MVDRLNALCRLDVAGIGSLLPAPVPGLSVRLVDPFRVVALRHLPGGAPAIETAANEQALPRLPVAGHFEGHEPYFLWCNSREWLLITTSDGLADDLLHALPASSAALAYAVDRSAGSVIFELTGADMTVVLPRLFDAGAIPQKPGQGTRARFVDIAVIALHLTNDRIWLLADRGNDRYIAQWLTYAIKGAPETA